MLIALTNLLRSSVNQIEADSAEINAYRPHTSSYSFVYLMYLMYIAVLPPSAAGFSRWRSGQDQDIWLSDLAISTSAWPAAMRFRYLYLCAMAP